MQALAAATVRNFVPVASADFGLLHHWQALLVGFAPLRAARAYDLEWLRWDDFDLGRRGRRWLGWRFRFSWPALATHLDGVRRA